MFYNTYDVRIKSLDYIIDENLKEINGVNILYESYGIVLEGEKWDNFKKKVKDAIDKIIQKIKDIIDWIKNKIQTIIIKIKLKKYLKSLKKQLEEAKRKANNAKNESASFFVEAVTADKLNEFLNSESSFTNVDYEWFNATKHIVMRKRMSVYLTDDIFDDRERIENISDIENKLGVSRKDETKWNYEKFINEFGEQNPQTISDQMAIIISKIDKALKTNLEAVDNLYRKIDTVSDANSLRDLVKINDRNTERRNLLEEVNKTSSFLSFILAQLNHVLNSYLISYRRAEDFLIKVNNYSVEED